MGHFYAPTLHLAASAPVNGEHRSINNVYILTSCAVMYIPAFIGCLLSSLCISSPLTFTQPQAFRLCYYDKYILLLLVEMENSMHILTVFRPSCNLPETDLLTRTFICEYISVISALKLLPLISAWLCIWALYEKYGIFCFFGFISNQGFFFFRSKPSVCLSLSLSFT